MFSMLPAAERPLPCQPAALWLLSEHSRLLKFTAPQGSWWMVFSRLLLASLLTLSPRGKWLRVFLCEDQVFPLWPRLPWVGFVALWLPVACTAWLPQQAAMLSAVLPKLSVFPKEGRLCPGFIITNPRFGSKEALKWVSCFIESSSVPLLQ